MDRQLCVLIQLCTLRHGRRRGAAHVPERRRRLLERSGRRGGVGVFVVMFLLSLLLSLLFCCFKVCFEDFKGVSHF